MFKSVKEKIIQNLKDTITLIKWNEKNGIKVFRLSSELFPHKSNYFNHFCVLAYFFIDLIYSFFS